MAIKIYDMNMSMTEILEDINKDVKSIEPRNILKDILEKFVKKHSLYKKNGTANISLIAPKLLKINDGVKFATYSNKAEAFSRNVENWYTGTNSFVNKGVNRNDDWTSRQKLIAFMLYSQVFKEDEVDEFLKKYGYDSLYILDAFESTAKICFRYKKTYNEFLVLLKRVNDIINKPSYKYEKIEYTPQIAEDFECITSIENDDFLSETDSFFSFVEGYYNQFGRPHKTVHQWLENMLKIAKYGNIDGEIVEESLSIIQKMLKENRQLLGNLKKNNKAKKIGGAISEDIDEYEKTRDILINTPWLHISEEERKSMLSNETSVSRDFLLHNIVLNMSYQYINEYYFQSELEAIVYEKHIKKECIENELIRKFNENMMSFGFATLDEHNGPWDFILLTAVKNALYFIDNVDCFEENREPITFPFRKFAIGNYDELREYMSSVEYDTLNEYNT